MMGQQMKKKPERAKNLRSKILHNETSHFVFSVLPDDIYLIYEINYCRYAYINLDLICLQYFECCAVFDLQQSLWIHEFIGFSNWEKQILSKRDVSLCTDNST